MKQSSICNKYGVAAKAALALQREAEEEVKVARSQLIKGFKEKNSKATGQEIEAYYRLHPKHKKAKENAIKAEFKANVLDVAYNRFQFDRKAALEHEVTLYLAGYFGEPKERGGGYNRKFKEEALDKVSSMQRSKMNRKRKVTE